MNTEIRKRRGLAALYRLCPAAHIIALISALIIALHMLLRGNYALMQAMSQRVIRPLHRLMAVFAAHFEFSLAELLIGIFAVCIAGYILVTLALLIARPGRLRRLYTLVLRLLAAGLAVYALFCLLWGTYYYGDSFLDASGLERGEVSAEQLETVTVYFADLLNQYGREVERDENGQYAADRAALLARSDEVFRAAEEEFPCLEGPDIRAKGVHFSRVMSYLDFTGFFFPFTAEANVNTDFPGALFASTIALPVRRDIRPLHCGNYEFGRVPMHRIAGRVKRSAAHSDAGSAAYMGRGICRDHRFMDQSREILKFGSIKAKLLAAGAVRICRHGACQSLPAGTIPADGLCGYHRGAAGTVTCDGRDGFVSAESVVLREAHGRVNYHTAASRS